MEETLSDKIIEHEEYDNPVGDCITVDYLKQFIKDIKEVALKENPYNDWTDSYKEFEENRVKEIDKLAGEKLI